MIELHLRTNAFQILGTSKRHVTFLPKVHKGKQKQKQKTIEIRIYSGPTFVFFFG